MEDVLFPVAPDCFVFLHAASKLSRASPPPLQMIILHLK